MVHQSVRKVVGFGTMDEVEQGGQEHCRRGRAEGQAPAEHLPQELAAGARDRGN